MARKIRKAKILPETRQEWFQRFSQHRESPRQIAEKDKADIRTVRKHIDLARREIEVREARLMVLRDAIGQHYKDLVAFALKLERQLNSDRGNIVTLKANPFWFALRQHLPRSAMWKNFDKWEHLLHERTRLEQILNNQVEKQVEAKSMSIFHRPHREVGLSVRMIEALSSHIRDAALGQPEVLENFDFHKISDNNKSDSVRLADEILSEASAWEEFSELSRFWSELEKVKRILRDELDLIKLRRVVPGKCRYCPI